MQIAIARVSTRLASAALAADMRTMHRHTSPAKRMLDFVRPFFHPLAIQFARPVMSALALAMARRAIPRTGRVAQVASIASILIPLVAPLVQLMRRPT